MLRKQNNGILFRKIMHVVHHSQMPVTHRHIQHGDTSVLLHCIAVACLSMRFAQILEKMGMTVRTDELVRGALLHDYFLYDWHEKDPSHALHGFIHPIRALRNADKQFCLSERERDIISRHMFPLTFHPPRYIESILVCIADKICSLYETFTRGTYQRLRKQMIPLVLIHR